MPSTVLGAGNTKIKEDILIAIKEAESKTMCRSKEV